MDDGWRQSAVTLVFMNGKSGRPSMISCSSSTLFTSKMLTLAYCPATRQRCRQVPAFCSVGDNDLAFDNLTHNGVENHQACSSITYGPNYEVGATGIVTATAPSIVIENDSTFDGTFTAVSDVP